MRASRIEFDATYAVRVKDRQRRRHLVPVVITDVTADGRFVGHDATSDTPVLDITPRRIVSRVVPRSTRRRRTWFFVN